MKKVLVVLLLLSLMITVNAQEELREQRIKQIDFCHSYAKVKVTTEIPESQYKIEGCTNQDVWWQCGCNKETKIINLLYKPNTKGIFNYKIEYNVQALVPDNPTANALAKRNVNIANQQIGYIRFDPAIKSPSAMTSNQLAIVIGVVSIVLIVLLGLGFWYVKKLWAETEDV